MWVIYKRCFLYYPQISLAFRMDAAPLCQLPWVEAAVILRFVMTPPAILAIVCIFVCIFVCILDCMA